MVEYGMFLISMLVLLYLFGAVILYYLVPFGPTTDWKIVLMKGLCIALRLKVRGIAQKDTEGNL